MKQKPNLFTSLHLQDAVTEKLAAASTAFEKEVHRLKRDLAQSKKDTAEAEEKQNELQREVNSLQEALEAATSAKVMILFLR